MKSLVWRWYSIVVGWLLLDQLSKIWAVHSLQMVGSRSILGELLRFTYAENRGMAFSISIFPPWLLTAIAILASLAIAGYLWKFPKEIGKSICLSFILAGAIGNVVDRIHYGYVIDFIDFDFPDFIMNRWPIFNLADSGITVGIVVLAILTFFESKATSPESSTEESR